MSQSQKPNHSTEILDADKIEGDEAEEAETTEDDAEETVIPEDPLGEKTKTEGGDDTSSTDKEEESESDADVEEDEESESDEGADSEGEATDEEADPDSLENELKPVPGETPREKALRNALLIARRDNTKLRSKKLMEGAAPTEAENAISEEDYKELREIYSDEEIQKMEKFIDIVARKKGYVKSETLRANEGNQALDGFIKQHPQYDPENDPGDKNWKTFTKILERDYNYKGKKPDDLVVIFAKVHRDVNKELGITDNKQNVALEKRKLDAKRQKVRAAGFSGGAGTSAKGANTKTDTAKKPIAKTIDPKVKSMFKGFSDSDFEE